MKVARAPLVRHAADARLNFTLVADLLEVWNYVAVEDCFLQVSERVVAAIEALQSYVMRGEAFLNRSIVDRFLEKMMCS